AEQHVEHAARTGGGAEPRHDDAEQEAGRDVDQEGQPGHEPLPVLDAAGGDHAGAGGLHAPAGDRPEGAAHADHGQAEDELQRRHAAPPSVASSPRAPRRLPSSRPRTIAPRHSARVSAAYSRASSGKSAPIIAEPSSTTADMVVKPPHSPVPSSGRIHGRPSRTSSTPLSAPSPREPSTFTVRVAHGTSTSVGVVTAGSSTVSRKRSIAPSAPPAATSRAIRQVAGAGRTGPETRVSESATSTSRRAASSTVCMRGSSRRGGGEEGGLEVTAQGY